MYFRHGALLKVVAAYFMYFRHWALLKVVAACFMYFRHGALLKVVAACFMYLFCVSFAAGEKRLTRLAFVLGLWENRLEKEHL
jgi:hypothetical protein